MKLLEKEFHYFIAHQDELVQQYNGKYIVIQGTEVPGAYETVVEAVQKTCQQGYELGTFFVQHCIPGETDTHNGLSRFRSSGNVRDM